MLSIKKADLAVAPLTITESRAHVIDFTNAYQDLGLMILMAKETRMTRLLAFLDPFIGDLWLAVVSTFIIVGVVVTCLR